MIQIHWKRDKWEAILSHTRQTTEKATFEIHRK